MELFGAKSTSDTSRAFSIGKGEAVLISAFGLIKQQRAVIQKVRFKDGIVPSGSACGGEFNIDDAKILAVEDVTQCGVWAINPCQNLAVLSVPGVYRLKLDDGVASGESAPGMPVPVAPSTAVGHVIIEAERMSANEAANIPQHLFFGFISPCTGC